MNSRLIRLLNKYGNRIRHGTWLNCYDQQIGDIASTIMVGISFRNMYFVAVGEGMKQDKENVVEAKRIGGLFDTEEQKHQAGSIWDKEGLSPNIDTMQGGYRQPLVVDTKAMINNLRIRKLTPKECWRLMGWDDESFSKAEKVNSNSALYKQAGNGIVTNVISAIIKEML